jgi:hypothetical protein
LTTPPVQISSTLDLRSRKSSQPVLDREAIDFAQLGDRDPRQIVGRDGRQGIASPVKGAAEAVQSAGPGIAPSASLIRV